jgi:hypothetical protein
LESIVDTQPQLQPAVLRLSAMISQYFIFAASIGCEYPRRHFCCTRELAKGFTVLSKACPCLWRCCWPYSDL